MDQEKLDEKGNVQQNPLLVPRATMTFDERQLRRDTFEE